MYGIAMLCYRLYPTYPRQCYRPPELPSRFPFTVRPFLIYTLYAMATEIVYRLSVPHSSHRHFSSLARRLGRIFAHAYFHHREAFEQAEAESSLYARFLALTSKFDLVPAEFLVIPPRLSAMGEDGRPDHVEPPRLLGASLDPRRNLSSGPGDDRPWNPSEEHARSGLGERGTNTSPAPPAQRRNESPRKFGRNRTDTMVYSEAFSVAEELAKGELSEVDIDREIAAERAAAAVEADVPTSAVLVSPASTTPPIPPPQELAPEEEPNQEEEEEHEEPKEDGDSAHTEEPSEVPEPEAKIGEAEDTSSHEEAAPVEQAESVPSAPHEATEESHAAHEETPVRHDEAAEEKADAEAVESSLLESLQEPAPKVGEPASLPPSASSHALAAQEEPTAEASKDEEEEESDEEEGEDEEEGSDEEEESSDEESDVSSTVVGVVNDGPVVAAAIVKEEVKPDVPEEADEAEDAEEEEAPSTKGEKVEES